MQQGTPNNPFLGLIFLSGLAGACFDFIYWKRGGAKTPKAIVRYFQFVLLGIAIATIVIAVRSSSYVAGSMAGLMLDITFLAWEYRRWQIRRRYRIGQ